MINWNEIISYAGRNTVERFAKGDISGRKLYDEVVYTTAGGEVRRLLRNRGVTEARQLARKALSRR